MYVDHLRSAVPARRLLAASTVLAGICLAGAASAQSAECPDTGGALPAQCNKEVRILNNTGGKIYVVIQGSIIRQAAIGCADGDVWLQRALGIVNQCLPVKHDYHLYVNPVTGIAKGAVASISLPWWSKRLPGAPDAYVDWWRSGRLYIFDDPKALADIYEKERNTPEVEFAQGSPLPECKKDTDGNVCSSLQMWQVKPEAELGTQTPAQLNEYTFASVDGPKDEFKFVNLNQNYNVSNVDQSYLPLAMEPIRPKSDIGYMGTTISVVDYRTSEAGFTGTAGQGADPSNWPVYNNPTVGGKLLYPKAGLRVHSAETVFNFYMKPYFFGGSLADQNIPQLLPYDPKGTHLPKYVKQVIARWAECTNQADSGQCPVSGKVQWATFYQSLYTTFVANYGSWRNFIATGDCTAPDPDYLAPEPGSNPPVPANKYALLRYIYGWVPFNIGCKGAATVKQELPTVDQGNKLPISYVQVQYDYEIKPHIGGNQVFNPYTSFVHDPTSEDGLDSNAYAFSIDDRTAFQSNSGSGLIFAVGGSKGLPNTTKVLPTVPQPYAQWDIGIYLGPKSASTHWARYGICETAPNMDFPISNDGFAIGIDPAISNFPCTVSLEDTNGVIYQFKIKSAEVPPNPIWPFWPNAQGYDKSIINCTVTSSLPWCEYVNEQTIPAGQKGGPVYSLSARSPL